MTIIIAVIIIPHAVIVYADHTNLSISAENPLFDNHFGGPQVIQVVVHDYLHSGIDYPIAEPDVTINGVTLRMVQAVNGNWYGYFADKNMAILADSTSQVPGVGLDFGDIIIDPTDRRSIVGIDLSDANGVAVPTRVGHEYHLNVVRNAAPANTNVNNTGQIGINDNTWPFIQLYDFTPSNNVVIQYNEGSFIQTTTLTFDNVGDYAGLELDREIYPNGAQVHATITDIWLNIDPTGIDSWTFDTVNGYPNYRVFDINGNLVGDVLSNTDQNSLHDEFDALMCDDNCVLLLNPDTQDKGDVVTLQPNDNAGIVINPYDKSTWATPNGNLAGMQPITITERGSNSGEFNTYDKYNISVLAIDDYANRGTSATLDYNDTPNTILVGFESASLDIVPVDDTWNSSESIPIVLVDEDANKNGRVDEDLLLNNPKIDTIPSFVTGNPFTLGGSEYVVLATFYEPNKNLILPKLLSLSTDFWIDRYSDRMLITPTREAVVDSILVDLGATVGDWKESVNLDDNFRGFNFYSQDVSSFGDGPYDVWLLFSQATPLAILQPDVNNPTTLVKAIKIANDIDASSGLVPIDENISALIGDEYDNENLGLAIVGGVNTVSPSDKFPIVADFFSYGFYNNGELSNERVANQIIRIEAQESDENTGIFDGDLEYIMVNQLDVLDMDTYTNLLPIDASPTFIAIDNLTGDDIITVNYLDIGSSGTYDLVYDQQEASGYSGTVYFDREFYKPSDIVTITLEDADLNVNSKLIDIFTINDLSDTIGKRITYVDSNDTVIDLDLNTGNLGRMLDITFDDELWTSPELSTCNDYYGTPFEDITFTGLDDSGFTLVETGHDTGIFKGSFEIPEYWCRSGNTVIETTIGIDIGVHYVDFRNIFGNIVEVHESASIETTSGPKRPIIIDMPSPNDLTITGIVYVDSNENGKLDPTESGIFDIEIKIATLGSNVVNYTTKPNGLYTFDNLKSGNYILYVEHPSFVYEVVNLDATPLVVNLGL